MTEELWLLILCCVVLAIAPLWYLYRANELGSRRVAQAAFWIAIVLLGAGGIALTVFYAFPGILMFFIAVLYPILRVLMDESHRAKKEKRALAQGGNAALFRSAWLEIRIDDGKFSGNVRQGKMQNWHLHEMDGYDLMHLRAEFLKQDALAVALLDVWLDHEGPVHWRRDFGSGMLTTPTPAIAVTDRAEAAAMLGVAADAPPAAIMAAKERLEGLIGKGGEHSTLLDMVAASAKLLGDKA